MTAFVIVPTLNAAMGWPSYARALLDCVSPQQVLVIDSSSTDRTEELVRSSGFRFYRIPRAEFSHGGTRQLAAEMLSDADILVYLTQDAVLAGPDALQQLLAAFDDPLVAAAYGRQLPRRAAKPIEEHARLFNYPKQSSVRTLANREWMGFKTIFISNSFAAYRRETLLEVGGFPRDVIFGEDTIAAARLLLAGWKVAYVADAQVRHSHSYTWKEEFRRYFDIGVLHAKESWLLCEFGHAGGEGKRFVLSEMRYLWTVCPWLIPSAIVRTGLKLLGYRLGRMEKHLGLGPKRRLSMHQAFWK